MDFLLNEGYIISVNNLIWYIVYPAAVARCAFGDQMKTEDVTQGAHAQVAGLR